MEVHAYQPAKTAGRELVIEGADMRVRILRLAEKESIPWHYQSEITDSFICLEGSMVVESACRTTNTSFDLAHATKFLRWSHTMSTGWTWTYAG